MKESKPKLFVTHSEYTSEANPLPCADYNSQTLSLLHSIDIELCSHLLISVPNNICLIHKHTSSKGWENSSQLSLNVTWSFLTFTTRISSLHLWNSLTSISFFGSLSTSTLYHSTNNIFFHMLSSLFTQCSWKVRLLCYCIWDRTLILEGARLIFVEGIHLRIASNVGTHCSGFRIYELEESDSSESFWYKGHSFHVMTFMGDAN